jgi:hypothetical protein
MELITAANYWQIMNKSPCMNCTACCETCCYAVYKLITSLLCKHYQLIHQQNSYAPHGRQHTGCCEAHSCELIKWVKILPLVCNLFDFDDRYICNYLFVNSDLNMGAATPEVLHLMHFRFGCVQPSCIIHFRLWTLSNIIMCNESIVTNV